VRALCQQFDEAVTAVCLEYIGNMVQLYQSNPASWKSKDAAIALMLAITVRAESAAKGASMLNERVDVMTFFTNHVSEKRGGGWTGVDEQQITKGVGADRCGGIHPYTHETKTTHFLSFFRC
jgi:hypothetical protein